MNSVLCNLKHVLNTDFENTDLVLKYLEDLVKPGEDEDEFNIFLEDEQYCIVEFQILSQNTYKILYYNNALPLPENALITFGKNINGFIHKTRIKYELNYISEKSKLNCKCKYFTNQVCGRHIIRKPCKKSCDNLSRKQYNIRYFEATLETLESLHFKKTFQSYVTPVVVLCKCTVLETNILLLTSNTCYLGINLGKIFYVYSLYLNQLVKCTLTSKKTTHGNMVLICEHSFDKRVDKVVVIDTERFLLQNFKLK